MIWKENSRKTIYELKENDLDICIHKINGLGEALFLSCPKLCISDHDLKTEDFTEAVKQSQVYIIEKAVKIYEAAADFAKNVYGNNTFSRY